MTEFLIYAGVASAIFFTGFYLGLRVRAAQVTVLETKVGILEAAVRQGGKAAEATGEVLKKVRERDDGPLDRSGVRRMFGGGGSKAGPPGGGAAGPGPGVPSA